ncbi:MAG: hypothetical protein QXL86_03845 [Candidatus Aenigmatarchaeota archaeon]
MAKAQADIISAVIIVLIAIGLTATALMWGLPLIQKRQDSIMVERVSRIFSQELPSKIVSIANTGGSDTVTIDVNGVWILDESRNMLSFTFFSKASDKAVGIWIGGGECQPDGFNGKTGELGLDQPCVVCVRSDEFATGYNITYQIGCRMLNSTANRYLIKLVPASGVTSSTLKTIKISRGSTITQDNLIKTEINILL